MTAALYYHPEAYTHPITHNSPMRSNRRFFIITQAFHADIRI